MNAVTEMPDPLVFTDNAAAKVRQLIEEEGNNELKLRVFVTGGGCSGFQYGFTFEESVNEDDTPMQKNGVTLLIAVRDQEPECNFDLRLRIVVLRLIQSHQNEKGRRWRLFSWAFDQRFRRDKWRRELALRARRWLKADCPGAFPVCVGRARQTLSLRRTPH